MYFLKNCKTPCTKNLLSPNNCTASKIATLLRFVSFSNQWMNMQLISDLKRGLTVITFVQCAWAYAPVLISVSGVGFDL